MRKVTNLGSGVIFAVLVASGMVALSTPVMAQGPGGGKSQTVLCTLLAAAEENVNALPDSEFKTAFLASINARQAALGCAE